MMEFPITIPQGDEILCADLTPGGTTAVLILSGWGGTRYGPQRILLQTAQALAAQGITTLRLDFRGRGDSSGDASTVTLDSMIEDTVTAIRWLRSKQHITHLQMIGLCSGGNVALGAASWLPDEVEQVICWSLLPFMEDKLQVKQSGQRKALWRQLLKKAFNPQSWRKLLHGEANVRGAINVVVKEKEGDEEEKQRKTSQRDILANLTTFQGKLHLIYGSQDPEASGAQAFFTNWCQVNKIPLDVHVITDAPHNFYTAAWTKEVIAQTASWVTACEK